MSEDGWGCQHSNPHLHRECSADCLIYDCSSEWACCNSDCHPDQAPGLDLMYQVMVLGVLSILARSYLAGKEKSSTDEKSLPGRA